MLGEKLLSVKQAAEFLGISRKTLYRYEDRGFLIPLRTPTGHRRYRRADLEDFLRAMETRGHEAAAVSADAAAGAASRCSGVQRPAP